MQIISNNGENMFYNMYFYSCCMCKSIIFTVLKTNTMRTIASNYNGTVKATANQGFSVKTATSRIEKAIITMGCSSEKHVAKTGSTYITVYDANNFSLVEIRVANHTKRSAMEMHDTDTFIYGVDRFSKKVVESVNILNSDNLNEFISNIEIININL